MKIIKLISEKIEDEICDAREYAELAIEYKESYPELSKTFYTLSTQEMEHMNILHKQVTELIRHYRETEGEPPSDMLAVYNYLHKQQMEKTLEVKVLQSMYAGS